MLKYKYLYFKWKYNFHSVKAYKVYKIIRIFSNPTPSRLRDYSFVSDNMHRCNLSQYKEMCLPLQPGFWICLLRESVFLFEKKKMNTKKWPYPFSLTTGSVFCESLCFYLQIKELAALILPAVSIDNGS